MVAGLPSTPLRRLDARVERTRSACLQAARLLLVEEGWEAITQVRVAEQAGIGRATVYRHWPDRLALLRDTLDAELINTDIPVTGDLRIDLTACLEALRFEMVERRLDRVLATLVDRSMWEPEMLQIRVNLVKAGISPLLRILDQGMQSGALPANLNRDDCVAGLVGPIVWHQMISSQGVSSDFVDETVDQFLAQHLRPRLVRKGRVTIPTRQ